jgi:hypothetical protein
MLRSYASGVTDWRMKRSDRINLHYWIAAFFAAVARGRAAPLGQVTS